ncbi:MAG: hypothetical protein A3F78_07960 [Burkholderiales bacterium RIFCSPLOWO2_12_FULL_61_40]|nr:MAG: hypothetical protein A3F78_07960 [Burkholderiales bacterium RIFCSPLOWO2_12_FULL_61_40]
MSTLQAELDRLYLSTAPSSSHPHAGGPDLVASDGRVRALVLELGRPADWNALSALWRGVQADLALPAPAIAVSGVDAYQLWFSLAEPVSVAAAQAFLEALRLRYLGTVAPGRIGMLPCADTSAPGKTRHARLVPARQPDTGLWSAFVAPDLAAIFAEEPWLDLPPSPDAQAHVLSRLECIQPAVFQALLERTTPVARPAPSPMACATGERAVHPNQHTVAESASQGQCLDPKQFLLDVMNDPAIALPLRIEAAKALLPFSAVP